MSTSTRISELRLSTLHRQASVEFLQSLLPTVGSPPSWEGLARLDFRTGTQPQVEQPDTLPAFWKLSIFTDDITELTTALRSAGVEVSEPVQFGEIGYLGHLHEPGGNSIELIQRTFRHSPPVAVAAPDTLGLITLRVSDPEVAERFYTEALGMQLVCTMAVDDGRPDPFDLYFFGYIDEPPPDPNPAGIANREWLYQQRVTLIELQHYRPPTPRLRLSAGEAPGLECIVLETNQFEVFVEQLRSSGINTDTTDDQATFTSPDGHRFTCANRTGRSA